MPTPTEAGLVGQRDPAVEARPERREWVMFAFDTRERAVEGKREGEWTTVAPTELEVVRSMAFCQRELGAGRWPE